MYRVNILEGHHSPKIHIRILVKEADSKLDAIGQAIEYLHHHPEHLPDELEHHLYGIKVIELIDFHGSNTVTI